MSRRRRELEDDVLDDYVTDGEALALVADAVRLEALLRIAPRRANAGAGP
jgi:hypothetical protein